MDGVAISSWMQSLVQAAYFAMIPPSPLVFYTSKVPTPLFSRLFGFAQEAFFDRSEGKGFSRNKSGISANLLHLALVCNRYSGNGRRLNLRVAQETTVEATVV